MKENVQVRANQLRSNSLNKHLVEETDHKEDFILPTNGSIVQDEYKDIIRKAIEDLSEEKKELRKLANQTLSAREKGVLKR
jgi:hypothetical protein